MAKVAIVGCGFVGRAWAIVFARAGNEVHLWDRDKNAADNAIGYIKQVLDDLARFDLLAGRDVTSVLSSLIPSKKLADALDGAIYVQENTPEDLSIKHGIFTKIDQHSGPDTIIASSTSALLPSLLFKHLAGRERCLVAHPINPPYLVPAVEIVPSPWTSERVVKNTSEFLTSSGQAPILMKKEYDGFIMNRMQGALLEEAFRLVAEGYASVDDVDIGIREGLALRWSFMGPFETIDLNAPGGIADYIARYQPIYENIFPQMQHRVDWDGNVLATVEGERRQHVAQDELEERQKWRDRRMMALIAHKRKSDREFGK
jgi:L-gulonate 3-dehydrogenase